MYVMCEPKNDYQKDVCLKEIGLCAKNLLTIPCSTININEGVGRREEENASLSSYGSTLLALKNHSNHMRD